MISNYLIIPERIHAELETLNPSKFKQEDMRYLFGVAVRGLAPSPTFILTNLISVPGANRSLANVNTFKAGIRNLIQIQNNGLFVVARSIGLIGQTIGIWHTHPDSPNTTPSYDDRDTYHFNAIQGELDFFFAPISCRWAGRKYTKWFLYLPTQKVLVEMPKDNILLANEDDLSRIHPLLTLLIEINPSHFVSHLDNRKEAKNEVCSRRSWFSRFCAC